MIAPLTACPVARREQDSTLANTGSVTPYVCVYCTLPAHPAQYGSGVAKAANCINKSASRGDHPLSAGSYADIY
jgi:hypothetical protein